jgi:hypothetical protein
MNESKPIHLPWDVWNAITDELLKNMCKHDDMLNIYAVKALRNKQDQDLAQQYLIKKETLQDSYNDTLNVLKKYFTWTPPNLKREYDPEGTK